MPSVIVYNNCGIEEKEGIKRLYIYTHIYIYKKEEYII